KRILTFILMKYGLLLMLWLLLFTATTDREGYPVVGAYVPQCEDNGQYTASQCHGSTGHCWCVDGNGQERAGTRTPPGCNISC
uniref:Thyroglobulin type-1 domain-containing protein n=1 Tax=Cyclopterus lumpus TaxID=8103 RepID=A0A8C2WKY9_CYCLU